MDEVMSRIGDLEHIQEVSKQKGIIVAERWAMAELAEMKVIMKRMKKAPAATGTR